MLRRRHHARSKNGCVTCKERHVRCDERTPYCRNCVRLGRECRYPPKDEPQWVIETPEALQPASQQEWVANNLPHQHTVYYCAPHHRNISSTAISIVQQSQAISLARPMPRSCWATITQDYVPRYNYLAAQHDCVKYALVSFAAYTHFQATKSPLSEDVCIRHATAALRELQREITNFGASNADAIVTASVALAGTAKDWEQWSIFVEGYSKTLSYIRDSGLTTVFPDLLGERFQLRHYALMIDSCPTGPSHDRSSMRQQVASVLQSIADLKPVIGLVKWRVVGLEELEKLGKTIDNALSMTSEAERYHQLAWLRSWMFWIDLRKENGGKEQIFLSAHFYALLLAIVPIFPARYRGSLAKVCESRIQAAKESSSDDFDGKGEIADLLE